MTCVTDTFVGAIPEDYRCDIVLLHGHNMRPDDFTPFAASLQLPARFVIPAGPILLGTGSRAWWQADRDRQAERVSESARDLADFYPAGRIEARNCVEQLLHSFDATGRSRPLILGGFSQGAMLATELLLHRTFHVRGAVLLSSTRLAISEWDANRSALRGQKMLICHGTHDRDLSFSAGLRLKEWATESDANVTWLPFEGGHEVPLSVWRALKRFVLNAVCPPVHDPDSASC